MPQCANPRPVEPVPAARPAAGGSLPPSPPDTSGAGDGDRPRRGLLGRVADAVRAANAAHVPF
ncbi:hypothetical protein AFB00_09860 [Pseudonocardia sp. HH130630-07]|nr:hypothetical protein AFB00_09860 [Pseudonocardia sp. HH130630-07]